MNAVEIEEAVSALAEAPFAAGAFPYQFLAAFGNKETTLQRLCKGSTNKSDVPRGILRRNNIHIAVCAPGQAGETLKTFVASPATEKQEARYALATDGVILEAEDLALEAGETLACDFDKFGDHFGFFFELAGISMPRHRLPSRPSVNPYSESTCNNWLVAR